MDEATLKRMMFMALAVLLPFVSISCGGTVDFSGGAGTACTGVGPVTGFGSVIVNGLGYEDTGIDGTNFSDDHGRAKADLLPGMMVSISGTVNGTNGTADGITVLRHVDGPMDDNGVNLATGGLKVMGQDVLVDTSTAFDNGIATLADLRTLQAANVNHPELEVHGSADNNGVIHATFIHKWADDSVAGRDVQVRGTVAGPPTATTIVIGRQTVDCAGLAGGVVPAGVIAGSFVQARGSLGVSDNVLLATSVILEDATGGQPSGSRADVEGYVNRVLTPNASFELIGPNGVQTVTWTTGTTAFTGGAGADIGAGVKVEVEGTRKAGGVLAATKIAIRRASNVRLESAVTSVTAVSLTAFGKTVKVNALTRYKDARDNLKTFGQSDIAVNDSLKISAFLDNSTAPASIVATRVERVGLIGTDNNILQGPVDFALSPDLIVLGITVVTLPPPGTEFLRADGTGFATQGDFFSAIAVGDIVKARGNQATPAVIMIPNEVRIEPRIAN